MRSKDAIQEIASSPKVAGSVAGLTAAMGAAVESAISWIPDDIGKLATLIGIILSVILIRVHLTALRKAQYELKLMQAKEADRQAGISQPDSGN